MTSGVAGNNLETGEINVLVDPVPYVAKVANTEPTTGGADIEDDDTLKDRIYIAPSKYSVAGPEESYRYWLKTYNANISDALIYSDDPVDVTIEFIMTDGDLPSESMLLGVQKFLSDEQIRPLTDRVTVKVPETVDYKINVKYFVNQSDLKKVDTIKTAVNAAITPTQLGEMIYDVVHQSIRPLLNPELTASWEKGLTYVAEGSITSEEYMGKLENFVTRHTVNVKQMRNQFQLKSSFDASAPYYKKASSTRSGAGKSTSSRSSSAKSSSNRKKTAQNT